MSAADVVRQSHENTNVKVIVEKPKEKPSVVVEKAGKEEGKDGADRPPRSKHRERKPRQGRKGGQGREGGNKGDAKDATVVPEVQANGKMSFAAMLKAPKPNSPSEAAAPAPVAQVAAPAPVVAAPASAGES
jgi:hypothetical protein